MKKFTLSLLALLVFAFQLNAQQYVSTSPANRNVILEEFTGRNCGYCPDGHVIANQIAANNPGRFWAINVHAGGFSPTSFPNLNTTDGTTINNGFGITSYPNGVVNRCTASGISRSLWELYTNTQMAEAAECNVAGIYNIDQTNRVVSITVEVYYTANSTQSTNYLTVAMLQDSIMGSQSSGQSNPSQWINGQYCHMHVLRDIITPTWGDAITPTSQGSLVTKTYTYTIPETIGSPNGVAVDLNNVHFLAWVSEQYQGIPTRPILNACQLQESFDGIHVQSVTPTTIAPNENTNLTVTMKNYDENPTVGNTTVTISSSDQYLTIVNGTASFGTMSGNGGTATVNNAFTVRAAANTPNNHVFSINATATNNGTSTTSGFSLTCNAPCNAPTNLTATGVSNSIELSWTASPTASSYRVYRSGSLIAQNVTGTTFTDSNLYYNTRYCYTVKSNCYSGEISDASNEACAYTGQQCSAPTGVSAVAEGLDVTITWNPSATALSYIIIRNGSVIAEDVTGTTYTDANAPMGRDCYNVKSVCADGESGASNQSCVNVEAPCDEPTNLAGSYLFNEEDDFGVLIEWDAPVAKEDGLQHYNLYRSTNGNTYDKVAQIDNDGGNHFQYFDATGNSGLYFYQLRALYDWGGQTCESEPAHALDNPANNCIMVQVTAVGENAAATVVYPNPATDKLNVESNQNINELKVYNMLGALVYSQIDCGQKAQVNLSEMQKGIYFIQLTTATSTQTTRFVKE